ncbi:MAG TPA: sigma-70 family RNA polymerase sigma factor, partial [Ktedonobacterales bacterium]|nr:sigma-70 family RNA polymerase sigma factor [Ktedonobacterales bacterium]
DQEKNGEEWEGNTEDGDIQSGGDMVIEIETRAEHAVPLALESAIVAARPRLLRLAHLRGVPPDTAEDVVQETLLEAWRCLDRLYDPTGIDRWLDEICRNVCRRYARKQAAEQRNLALTASSDDGEQRVSEMTTLDNIADSEASDPIEALNRQDMALLLDQALGLLPDNAREVVELCYLRELPQREATDRLGLSLSALEARLHRARRQLRALFNGPLRREAEAFGLALDDASEQGWRETRLWCPLCGRRLAGMFIVQPDGSLNLHMRCPQCERDSDLCDIDSSSIHSKGLIQLDGLRSFRPAWKRTLQGTAQHFTQALQSSAHSAAYRCPFCDAPALLRLVDKVSAPTGVDLPGSLARHPYRFWVWWRCQQPRDGSDWHSGLFAASDLVYWSSAASQRFMRDHPHYFSAPELLVEYAGQPALRLQLADATSATRLTLLADRRTLRVLAVF